MAHEGESLRREAEADRTEESVLLQVDTVEIRESEEGMVAGLGLEGGTSVARGLEEGKLGEGMVEGSWEKMTAASE